MTTNSQRNRSNKNNNNNNIVNTSTNNSGSSEKNQTNPSFGVSNEMVMGVIDKYQVIYCISHLAIIINEKKYFRNYKVILIFFINKYQLLTVRLKGKKGKNMGLNLFY